VLGAERYEGADWGRVTSFDVAAKELAALGESEGIDCRGGGEDGVGS
jgi:hypothetical protein